MSPEPTGVHGLLKQRKLFTHKLYKDIYKILFYTPTLPTFPQITKYKENTHDYAIPDVVS